MACVECILGGITSTGPQVSGRHLDVRKQTTYGNAFGVTDGGRIATAGVGLVEIPAAEKAHNHARAGGGIGLSAVHRIPAVGIAGLQLTSPHTGIHGETGVQVCLAEERGQGVFDVCTGGIRPLAEDPVELFLVTTTRVDLSANGCRQRRE